MRMLAQTMMCLTAVALAFATGCQRVNETKTVDVQPGDVKAPLIVDGPARDQNVTLVVSSAGSPVDVFIVLEKDQKEAVDKAQMPKSSLASKQSVEAEQTLTAKIPAKSTYAVVIGNAKKPAKVSLKLTGK